AITTGPLVSVLMPVYNAEKHLRAAMDSILAQAYTNIEFVIVNDGSRDGSEALIRSYHDSRIRLLVNPENKGLIYSLNYGI
ncbi:UNVERIFIED_CONTAM: glycosyltransferase family 2 protein, partial [Salmonella enterica subsp. enterica serovar Weltevreden]